MNALYKTFVLAPFALFCACTNSGTAGSTTETLRQGRQLKDLTLADTDTLWDQAKKLGNKIGHKM